MYLKRMLTICRVSLFVVGLCCFQMLASGLPEPGIILYGGVTNFVGNVGRPLNQGTVVWDVKSATGDQRMTVSGTVTAGRYRLRIPFETLAGGATASGTSFILGGVVVQGTQLENVRLQWTNGTNYAATVIGSVAVFNLGADQRAAVRRMDIRVTTDSALGGSGSLRPSSFTGPGWWDEGGGGFLPGMRFTGIHAHPEGGVQVDWTGVPSGRGHYLLRAPMVDGALEEYEVVRWFPSGTATSYRDTNAVPSATYFYRLYTP